MKAASTIPNLEGSAYTVEMEAKNVPGAGRGIYAKTDIEAGHQIHFMEQGLYSARFYDVDDFRRFLLSLPKQLACEVTRWSYSVSESNSPPYIALYLGMGSIMNHGQSGTANVERGVAIRDISAGEQVRACDAKRGR